MKLIKSILPDLLILSGASGISYGAYLINEPYGYIVAGFVGLVIGVLLARANG